MAPKVRDNVFLLAALHAFGAAMCLLVPVWAGQPQAWNPLNQLFFTTEGLLELDRPLPSMLLEIMCVVVTGFSILYYHVYREGVEAHRHIVLVGAVYKLTLSIAVARTYSLGTAGVLPLFVAVVGLDAVFAVAFVAKLLSLDHTKQD
jgi:hypothetical protein